MLLIEPTLIQMVLCLCLIGPYSAYSLTIDADRCSRTTPMQLIRSEYSLGGVLLSCKSFARFVLFEVSSFKCFAQWLSNTSVRCLTVCFVCEQCTLYVTVVANEPSFSFPFMDMSFRWSKLSVSEIFLLVNHTAKTKST